MIKQKTVITMEQLQASMQQKCDNTGNVREWPSEEVLAYYLVQREKQRVNEQSDPVAGQRIIELGAGKSGLVGLVRACQLKNQGATDYEVVITDGNETCVENLQRNVALNPNLGAINATVLLWDRNVDPEPILGKFDQILISDCLFFEAFHIDLVYTIKQLAKPDAEILIAAPERGRTMA